MRFSGAAHRATFYNRNCELALLSRCLCLILVAEIGRKCSHSEMGNEKKVKFFGKRTQMCVEYHRWSCHGNLCMLEIEPLQYMHIQIGKEQKRKCTPFRRNANHQHAAQRKTNIKLLYTIIRHARRRPLQSATLKKTHTPKSSTAPTKWPGQCEVNYCRGCRQRRLPPSIVPRT